MIKSVIKQFAPSEYEDLIDIGFDVFISKKTPEREQVDALANKYITDKKIEDVQKALIEKYISECEKLGTGKYLTIIVRPAPKALILDFISNDIEEIQKPITVKSINLMSLKKYEVIPFVISIFYALTEKDEIIAGLEQKIQDSQDTINMLQGMEDKLKNLMPTPEQPQQMDIIVKENGIEVEPGKLSVNFGPSANDDDTDEIDTEIEDFEDKKPG